MGCGSQKSGATGSRPGAGVDNGALLTLLQIADSGFPTGGYAFSHGIEGLVVSGIVRDASELTELLYVQIEENLAGIELPAMRHAFRYTVAEDLEALLLLDDVLTALKPVPSARAASVKVGHRLLVSAAGLLPDSAIDAYLAAIDEGQARGHHAAACGVVFAAMGIDEEVAALALGAISLQGWTAAAVRLGVIGQTAAQGIIAALHPALQLAVDASRTRDLDDLGATTPMLDIAGLRQPHLVGRLFAS